MAYQWRRDAVALRRVQQVVKLMRIHDSALGLSFLAILDDTGAVLALANLSPRDPMSRVSLDLRETTISEAAARFVNMRAGWLSFEAAQ